jgi:hypothetical protein
MFLSASCSDEDPAAPATAAAGVTP